MSEGNNNNQNTQQTAGQNGEGQKNTQQSQNQQSGIQNTQTQSVDVDKVKTDAVNDLLKSMGYESQEDMKAALDAYKKHVDSQKSESERKDDELKETTKQLAEEQNARVIAEAKVEAMKLGVKPALVDDVVLIAKSRVTNEKDITAVLTEMKNNADEKMFFEDSDGDDGEGGKNQKPGKNVTRKNPTGNVQKQQNSQQDGAGKYAGTMAARLFQSRNKTKSYYFGNRK